MKKLVFVFAVILAIISLTTKSSSKESGPSAAPWWYTENFIGNKMGWSMSMSGNQYHYSPDALPGNTATVDWVWDNYIYGQAYDTYERYPEPRAIDPDRFWFILGPNTSPVVQSIFSKVMAGDRGFTNLLMESADRAYRLFPRTIRKYGDMILYALWSVDYDAQLVSVFYTTEVDYFDYCAFKTSETLQVTKPHNPMRDKDGRLMHYKEMPIIGTEYMHEFWGNRMGQFYYTSIEFFADKDKEENWSDLQKAVYRAGPKFGMKVEQMILTFYKKNGILAPQRPSPIHKAT